MTISGALHVWAAVFAAVLASTLDVAAASDPDASRKLEFQGQGVAMAVMLFLARRAGLSRAEVRDLVMSGAIGDRPSSRTRRAWDGWVRGHGDPARWLLGELAGLRAVYMPEHRRRRRRADAAGAVGAARAVAAGRDRDPAASPRRRRG